MGAYIYSSKGLYEVGPHVAKGSDDLAIMELLLKYANIFVEPVFLPIDDILHYIDPINSTAKPLKPKQ